jgi:predicted RNA-binding Zn-ribbon protein involved in translation (DUF1610 family)
MTVSEPLGSPTQPGPDALLGIRETRLFPDSETQSKALELAAKQLSASMSAQAVIGGLLALSLIAVIVLAPVLVDMQLCTPGLSEIIAVAAVSIPAVAILCWYLVRRLPPLLRTQLLEIGIPVCLACGYDLRGHDCAARKCPECGQWINTRAEALLAESRDRADVAMIAP